jgi:predicted nucleotidyltransferase
MQKILFIFCFLAQAMTYAQKFEPADTEAQYKAQYEQRIKKERLFGRYIPKDLNDAFSQFDILIEEKDRMSFKKLQEEEAYHKLFFSFQRWIINNWGFDGGSRFSHYLKGIGLSHPEDMAAFVMITYHRKLNDKELGVKELAIKLKDNRKNGYKLYQQKGKVIEEFKVPKKE